MKKVIRSRQDSNLRGQSPIDFESIALTTRPRLLLSFNAKFIHIYPNKNIFYKILIYIFEEFKPEKLNGCGIPIGEVDESK